MANAAVVVTNLADSAVVTTSSEVDAMPGALLLSVHVLKVWRSSTLPAYILADLGASVSIDTVALFGLGAGTGAEFRIRVSTADATGATGDALDTGTIDSSSAWFDPDYASLVYSDDAVTGRYVRIDIEESGVGYVEAGRLVIGKRTGFDTNFTPGSARGRNDLSRRTRTRGGQLLMDRQPRPRTIELNFDRITATAWETLIEPIDRDAGTTEDILVMLDPEADNLPRASYWGSLTDLTPVAFTALVDVVGKTFRLEERL